MPHDIRSAWFKTLGQLALILALAVVVGLLVGQVWPIVTLAALGVVAAVVAGIGRTIAKGGAIMCICT